VRAGGKGKGGGKGEKAKVTSTTPAAATPAPTSTPEPEAPTLESCCFFKTFRSQWQPGLPILECHAGEEGLRKCKNGMILT